MYSVRSEVSLGSHSSDTETIGEQLYHKVADVEPELCAQITGKVLQIIKQAANPHFNWCFIYYLKY
jgi:hypothetical protein